MYRLRRQVARSSRKRQFRPQHQPKCSPPFNPPLAGARWTFSRRQQVLSSAYRQFESKGHLRMYRLRRRAAGSLRKRRFRMPTTSIMRLSLRRSSLGLARNACVLPSLPISSTYSKQYGAAVVCISHATKNLCAEAH